jgi:hypothetical protein
VCDTIGTQAKDDGANRPLRLKVLQLKDDVAQMQSRVKVLHAHLQLYRS